MAVLIGALSGGGLLAFIGLLLSQYWPVFGGALERALAEPWSPARISLIPIHLFAFTIVGVLGGGAFVYLLTRISNSGRPE
jgi:hypothetical protein